MIDSYTHNSIFTPEDSVPLGIQLILVCQVVGLPYGTRLSYTWTCPNGPCELEGYYGRKVYNEHILAVNTTSTSDGGTYTCQVAATGGQEADGSFTFSVSSMCCTDRHVYVYGKLNIWRGKMLPDIGKVKTHPKRMLTWVVARTSSFLVPEVLYHMTFHWLSFRYTLHHPHICPCLCRNVI